jgi:hypothetical protein
MVCSTFRGNRMPFGILFITSHPYDVNFPLPFSPTGLQCSYGSSNGENNSSSCTRVKKIVNLCFSANHRLTFRILIVLQSPVVAADFGSHQFKTDEVKLPVTQTSTKHQ